MTIKNLLSLSLSIPLYINYRDKHTMLDIWLTFSLNSFCLGIYLRAKNIIVTAHNFLKPFSSLGSIYKALEGNNVYELLRNDPQQSSIPFFPPRLSKRHSFRVRRLSNRRRSIAEEVKEKEMEIRNLKLYMENKSIIEENNKLRRKAFLLFQENQALFSQLQQKFPDPA